MFRVSSFPRRLGCCGATSSSTATATSPWSATTTFPFSSSPRPSKDTPTSTAAAAKKPSSSSSDFWTSLRWKTVQALTTSILSPEEQEQFKKMSSSSHTTGADRTEKTGHTSNSDNDDRTETLSIAQAIAQARAEEALKHEQKWQASKDEIIREAQEAARQRIQHDLLIQQQQELKFQKWQQELMQEKQGKENHPASSPSEVPSEDNTHPVLGPVLADLGYKRIHVCSIQQLQDIPIWKKQRIYRHDRAKIMAQDKIKTMDLGLPGVIGLHQDLNGKLSILDGQHRIGMLSILHQQLNEKSSFLEQVLVEVYPQEQQDNSNPEQHAQKLFEEINKAEPVKLLDMPGVAKASERKLITEAAQRIHDRYPDMFSPTSRCRAPHLNLDNLRDALFGSQLHSQMKSSKALEEWILQQNAVLQEKYQLDEWRQTVSATALKKADKFQFYLGLDSSWLYSTTTNNNSKKK